MNKKGHVTNAVLLSLGLGVILAFDPRIPVTEEGATRAAAGIAELSLPVILGALFPDVDTAFGKHRKTLHNLPVLALFVAYPFLFGNLQFVWVGIATHYLLDVFGSKRGIALFYPLSKREYSFPTGVATSHRYADAVTLVITAVELVALAGVHYYLVPLDDGIDQALTAMTVVV